MVAPARRRYRAWWRVTGRAEEGVRTLEAFRRQGLVRPREGRIIAGVCAGIGRRFGLSPWVTRILFIITLIVIPGSQIIVYPLLWILMPSE
jgi:phage shock protein PspC (stress-responsive transcriptional regulator)